jgi:hypothetical protein
MLEVGGSISSSLVTSLFAATRTQSASIARWGTTAPLREQLASLEVQAERTELDVVAALTPRFQFQKI